MQMNKRLNYITLMQVIATAFIVLSHSVASSITYPSATGTVVAVIQNMGLTAFMWCSGYLMVKTDAVKKYGYKQYIRKRFIRLMIPFLVIQLLMLFPKILIARIIGQSADMSLPGIIHAFFYPREGILPHLWFLPTLMLLCIISPLLQKIARNKFRWGIVLVAAVALIYFPLDTNILCLNDAKNYLFWYFLGIGSAMYLEIDALKKLSNRGACVIFSTLLMSWSVLIFFTGSGCKIFSGMLSLILLLAISLKFEWGGVQRVGRYTFPIYILSLPIQNIVEICAGRFSLGWPAATALMFITGFLIPLLLASCVNKIESKCNLKLISRCIGL